MLSPDAVNQVRERADIIEVIGHVVELKKAGVEHSGLCPFHNERTPSFYVNPKKGVFKCHGCGEGGDVIEFVMRTQDLKFPDAIRGLAQRYGIVVDGEAGEAFDPRKLAEGWAKDRREREEEARLEAEKEAREHEVAAQGWRKVWASAKPAELDHPYLVSKGVTSVEGLRETEIGGERVLLVPMKGIGEGEGIMSLQKIWPNGDKLFAKGGRFLRTRTTIGGKSEKQDTIYVCEGWATGWSIHAVMKAPVVVAFATGNLVHIATHLRKKYTEARIIIAADNDRGKTEGGKPNPGVCAARKAAEAAGAEVAIPDFLDYPTGEKGPTDFNDLHQLEGELAVRRWLDPEHAEQACTVNALELLNDSGDEPVAPAAAPAPRVHDWRVSAPFRVLGYNQGTYYYLPLGAPQVAELKAYQHDKKNLPRLAGLSWWERTFGRETKDGRFTMDWAAAQDALLRACEREGVYTPTRLFGRGAWALEGGPVLHLGDRLLHPGGQSLPEEHISGRRIFERGVHMYGPSDNPLTVEEAREVLALFQGLRWRQPETAPYLMAGWVALAPMCGALPWRPHVWVVGAAGAGKTTVIEKMLMPLLGGTSEAHGMGWHYQGQSTEAGIRQDLRADALPVVVDEMEGGDQKQSARVQAILSLVRDASSQTGGRVAKGTVHGTSLLFRVRSMFCMGSIGGAVRAEADKTRISLLQLRSKDQGLEKEIEAHWLALQPRLQSVTPELGRRLIARTWRLLPEIVKPGGWMDTFRRAAATVLGDARAGDQYGSLYCGAWTLMSDDAPTMSDALDLIRSESLEEYVEDHVTDGMACVRVLLDQRERVEGKGQPRTLTIGDMVYSVLTGTHPAPDVLPEDADRVLRQIGMKVSDDGHWLHIANRSEWISRALRDTPYTDGWRTPLLSIPGAERVGTVRFTPMMSSRAVAVPMSKVRGD